MSYYELPYATWLVSPLLPFKERELLPNRKQMELKKYI